MNILFIDTETTGTDPLQNSILQIAAELYVDGKPVAHFNRKIKQDYCKVDLGALKVNRVKMQALNSYGEPGDLVAREFIDFLLDINSRYRDIYLGGHNVAFDVNFITNFLSGNNVTNIGALLPYRTVDTSSIGLFLRSVGLINIEKFNSENLFKHFDLVDKTTTLHEAMTDVRLTAQAYFKMQELVKALPSRFETILNHKTDFKAQLDNLMEPAAVANG